MKNKLFSVSLGCFPSSRQFPPLSGSPSPSSSNVSHLLHVLLTPARAGWIIQGLRCLWIIFMPYFLQTNVSSGDAVMKSFGEVWGAGQEETDSEALVFIFISKLHFLSQA